MHLSIGNKRDDNFHDIRSIFLLINLRDTLCFMPQSPESDENPAVQQADTKAKDEDLKSEDAQKKPQAPKEALQIEIVPENLPAAFQKECISMPTEKNLVYQAVKLFQSKTDFVLTGKIKVTKRIPAGAGLGGGSSDAATTLAALNKISGLELPLDTLRSMAEVLGSDVPFFIKNDMTETANLHCSYVSGRGDVIEPIDNKDIKYNVVVVNPGFASGTSQAYSMLDQFRSNDKNFIQKQIVSSFGKLKKEELVAMLQSDPFTWKYTNDFLGMFITDKNCGEKYLGIIADLINCGASFANLSGSGSTCFGIFKDKKTADKAAAKLKSRWAFAESV
ncbi:MAG: 4-(cytidine 5'-diphospho)-2-C-methyl-D-erythritol kinase [Termitinemataceae bacterium]|nr:MAG: 4-(cytidine 5'-diphospho)-2-C-methyl-D-erythritol kinase [Termitinemataceae bacterium]